MKNKFLLLGATALLSAGAIVANAKNPTVELSASIDIITASSFKRKSDIYYGKWIVPSNTSSITFSMDTSGSVTTTNNEATKVLTGNYGETVGIECQYLTLPSTFTFDSTPRNTASATITEFTKSDCGSNTYSCCIFGKDLVIEDTGDGGIKSGRYIGYFTVTAVLPN